MSTIIQLILAFYVGGVFHHFAFSVAKPEPKLIENDYPVVIYAIFWPFILYVLVTENNGAP